MTTVYILVAVVFVLLIVAGVLQAMGEERGRAVMARTSRKRAGSLPARISYKDVQSGRVNVDWRKARVR